jgi:hypothetical protein
MTRRRASRETPYLYRPNKGSQYAFLVIVDQPGAQTVGHAGHRVANKNVYVTIPIRRRDVSHANLVIGDGELVWFRPVQWCDSSTYVFSAREIWGADVQYQTIIRDPAVHAPALHLDTAYVGCAKFEPFSFNELLAALHVRAGKGAPADAKVWDALDPQLRDLIHRLSLTPARTEPPPKDFPHGVGSILIDSLKQFRAAEDMELAIYRALVTSRQWHGKARDLFIHDPAEVQVDFMASDTLSDLQRHFGLTPTGPEDGVPGENIRPSGRLGRMSRALVPTEVRWDLARMPAPVEFCMSYKTDLYFEVLDTFHVYRP